LFRRVAIVGVGLIGGSLGLALKARRLAEVVIGVGRDPARLDTARALGVLDEAATSLETGSA
jgi:prephenate dehydrogenase